MKRIQKLSHPIVFKLPVLSAIAVLLLFCGCSRNNNNTGNDVLTIAAARGDIRNVLTFVGNVTAGQSAELSWGTGGVIGKVNVKLGDRVMEGQILAELESDSLSADVINAEIPFIKALDDLEEVLYSETAKAQAYVDLKDKEKNLINSEKALERLKYPRAITSDIKYWSEQVEIYRGFYEEALDVFNDAAGWKNSPYKSDRDIYDQKRKNMLTALNNYAEVYNNYLYYSGKATDNDVAQAAANIDVARCEYENALKIFRTYSVYPRDKDIIAAQMKVDSAQNTYNRRNIIAGINGVVTHISAREGDYVTKNAFAFRLDDTDHLYMPMDISEIDILSIHDGMKAYVVLDADTKKTYNGIVKTVSAYGTASGNRVTFQTMVEIQEPDENVKIGMTGEVELILSEAENALIVPANAVYTDNGVAYVGVFNGRVCNEVPVTVGVKNDIIVQITGGFLNEGDLVCVPSLDSAILSAMGRDESGQGNSAGTSLFSGILNN